MRIEYILLSLAVLAVGGLLCSFIRTSMKNASRFGVSVCLTGTALSLLPAAGVLFTGVTVELRLPWHVPFGCFYLEVDPLSAFFIIVISVISALSAVFGMGYMKTYEGGRHSGLTWCFFNFLVASMLLVVTARNGLLFMMAWELMSLSSFFLVMFEHEESEVREAGWTYLTAAHLGAACLLALFAFLSGDGFNMDFDNLSAPSGALGAGLLFILAVLGFGSKAGFLPMHVWLPEAHPAAPSHVSAVMSGVMIKTGIYGLVRIIPALGPPATWWGAVLLLIGVFSGILGVLYALAQHDLKRLLAYHSVENIGIISMGLGLWILGVAEQNPVLATLGILGGLMHVCNHAVFKSLLFFGAGVIKNCAHTLDIDLLGGLQKKMPHTALTFFIGAAAICGLPTLNGFVSEFIIYLGAFGAVADASVNLRLALAGVITLFSLSVIGALAAACFAKVYGIIFLGAPRSDYALNATEPSSLMKHPMSVLALLCMILGLIAPLGVYMTAPAAAQVLEGYASEEISASVLTVMIYISMTGLMIVLLTLIITGFRFILQRGKVIASGQTWDCGYRKYTPRMQYTASSFALPVIEMFRWITRTKIIIQNDNSDFPKPGHLVSHTGDLFRKYLFEPVFHSFVTVSRYFHWMQEGRNQLYILYIAVTVLVLLLIKVR